MIEWLKHNQSWLINAATLLLALMELTEVTSLIPDQYNGLLAAIAASLNLILRFIAKQALGVPGLPADDQYVPPRRPPAA